MSWKTQHHIYGNCEFVIAQGIKRAEDSFLMCGYSSTLGRSLTLRELASLTEECMDQIKKEIV